MKIDGRQVIGTTLDDTRLGDLYTWLRGDHGMTREQALAWLADVPAKLAILTPAYCDWLDAIEPAEPRHASVAAIDAAVRLGEFAASLDPETVTMMRAMLDS